jgi:hypothetical protein
MNKTIARGRASFCSWSMGGKIVTMFEIISAYATFHGKKHLGL